MSPEQVAGIEVDHRADLWSLAVVAFECLTGQLPFRAESLADLFADIQRAPLPVPSRVDPRCPPELDRWWARAASRSLPARFASAPALAHALARALGVIEPSPEARALPPRPPMPRSSLAAAGLALALVPFAGLLLAERIDGHARFDALFGRGPTSSRPRRGGGRRRPRASVDPAAGRAGRSPRSRRGRDTRSGRAHADAGSGRGRAAGHGPRAPAGTRAFEVGAGAHEHTRSRGALSACRRRGLRILMASLVICRSAMPFVRRFAACLSLVLSMMARSSPVAAQPEPSDVDRATARALAREGYVAQQRGQYGLAAD